MKIKVKDIAQAAGVSPTAVSQVLNNKPCRLSESTKEKILSVAREMKFQNNSTISKEMIGRVKTIGLIVPDGIFFKELATKISAGLYKQDYIVFQCNVGDDVECCYRSIEGLMLKNVDGMIVIPPCTSRKDIRLQKMLKSLQESGVPMILADRAVYTVFCDFVTSDNKLGGKSATEYLISRGHKKIGCIMGNKDVYTVRKRIDGYKQAMVASGMIYDDELIYFGGFDEETGTHGTNELLKKGVTAIFAGSYEIAYGVYKYANEHNLKIPHDLSVIGFDNIAACEYMSPALTSVEQNIDQIAEKVVEVILRNLEKVEDEDAPSNYYYAPILKERDSVACVSK